VHGQKPEDRNDVTHKNGIIQKTNASQFLQPSSGEPSSPLGEK
jgi:hypothetical protein